MAEQEVKKSVPVTDVEKPGTTPADATSRPLIVGRGPAMKDPMVNEAKPATEEVVTPQPVPSTKKKTIQPLTEQPKEEAASKPGPASPDPENNPEAEEPDSEVTLAEEEKTAKSAADDAAQKLSEEELKRQELVDKLVAEKKYFVPIGAAQKKRTVRNTALLFVMFILVVSGAALAIDAELIQTDITLPFDLIK
jgi:hypothetical protein